MVIRGYSHVKPRTRFGGVAGAATVAIQRIFTSTQNAFRSQTISTHPTRLASRPRPHLECSNKEDRGPTQSNRPAGRPSAMQTAWPLWHCRPDWMAFAHDAPPPGRLDSHTPSPLQRVTNPKISPLHAVHHTGLADRLFPLQITKKSPPPFDRTQAPAPPAWV